MKVLTNELNFLPENGYSRDGTDVQTAEAQFEL